jgi:hypothetical protein
LNLTEELHNFSKTCRIIGVSRDTFYRYKYAVESSGIADREECRKPKSKKWINTMIEAGGGRLRGRATRSWSGLRQQRAEEAQDFRLADGRSGP